MKFVAYGCYPPRRRTIAFQLSVTAYSTYPILYLKVFKITFNKMNFIEAERKNPLVVQALM
jgi:hypothetical protein